ncbi:MAG: hypothetical protein HOV67_29565, partial [Kribbellaceae bacterium]|nr:hypothetical protein [Kribbellaceae bacterium]
ISPYRLDKIVQAAKKYADPQRAADEAAEAADERGVFVGRGDKHGNKTIYIKAPAAAVNRHDTAIADIAEALKMLGDTRSLQHRRAEAVGILPDSRFTHELLTQAAQTPAQSRSPQSTPTEPAPAGSTSAEPAPTHPTPTEPTPTEPTPTEPTPTEPTPTEPGCRAGSDSAAGSGSSAGGRTQHTDGPHSCGGAGLAGSDATAVPEPFGPADDPWLEAAGPEDPDPPTDPYDHRTSPQDPNPHREPDEGSPMDAAALRALHARLAQIKQDAYRNLNCPSHPIHPSHPSRTNTPDKAPAHPDAAPLRPDKGQVRPGKTEVVVHLTDHTLATGTGVLRAEDIGPLLATQLTELIGYGPYVVKPVIDLNEAISVNAYEIPTRIREHVKLIHPVELFPYGTRETTNTIDLDHIQPYDPLGPPGQTSTTNLAPLGRFGHRVKTHARGWNVHRIDNRTLEWTTPHGFTFHVDPTGTHRVDPRASPAPEQGSPDAQSPTSANPSTRPASPQKHSSRTSDRVVRRISRGC